MVYAQDTLTWLQAETPQDIKHILNIFKCLIFIKYGKEKEKELS